MFATRSGYDSGVNTFSPEGRLFQVEYAIEAIKLGTTCIGIRTKEGVVLGAEKRITSVLLEPSSVEKTLKLTDHIGAAISGLTADGRSLVEYARVESQNHFFTYNEPISVTSITQSICDKALSFGEEGKSDMSRPYGVALILGGIEEGKPILFITDPSGTFNEYKAGAIGSGQEAAQNRLQEEFNEEMSLMDASKLILSILKQVMEDKISETNIELATVTAERGFQYSSAEEVNALLQMI